MRKSLDPDSISDFRLDTDPERMYITNTDPKHLVAAAVLGSNPTSL